MRDCETSWLCPRWCTRPGERFHVPQQPSGANKHGPCYRPDLSKPQTGSTCRREATRDGFAQDRRRNSPALPQLPAPPCPMPCLPPGSSWAAHPHSPARAPGDLSPRAGRSSRRGPVLLRRGRGTLHHTCGIQPSRGQSREWQRMGRIPQETAGTYHAPFVI